MIIFALVSFQVVGFHRWPEAPESRAYLSARHRHVFHVKVKLELRHQEREVEFHDLLDVCKEAFGEGDFGASSCENMADGLLWKIKTAYPERQAEVEVSEDGENGALVVFNP